MDDTDFKMILTTFQQSPDAMPWATRCAVIRRLATALAEGSHTESMLELAYILAGDAKWEVRSEVADLLVLLPETHFARVAARLSEDTNLYVCRTAQYALDRRRRGQQTTRRARQEFHQVQSQYAAMEKLHGKAVAEKSRKIAQRLFDHMAAATVHEMRSILTPLMASTSSLQHYLDDGEIDPGKFRRQLTKTAERLRFLERLVEDMRSYSQPPPNERCRERLCDLVQSAAQMVRENIEAQGRRPDQVAVTIDILGSLYVEMSRHPILIAIANVLKNAYDAFMAGPTRFRSGTIAVSAQLKDEDTVEIVVQDNGMGICPEDLQEIMDFVPGKTTKKSLGTGFGLPIAQRNLAAHGGSLGIKSEVDVGTIVTILLPLETGGEHDLRSLGD